MALCAYVGWVVAVSDVSEGQTVGTLLSAAIFFVAITVLAVWAVGEVVRRVRAGGRGGGARATVVAAAVAAVLGLGFIDPEGAGYAAAVVAVIAGMIVARWWILWLPVALAVPILGWAMTTDAADYEEGGPEFAAIYVLLALVPAAALLAAGVLIRYAIGRVRG